MGFPLQSGGNAQADVRHRHVRGMQAKAHLPVTGFIEKGAAFGPK